MTNRCTYFHLKIATIFRFLTRDSYYTANDWLTAYDSIVHRTDCPYIIYNNSNIPGALIASINTYL